MYTLGVSKTVASHSPNLLCASWLAAHICNGTLCKRTYSHRVEKHWGTGDCDSSVVIVIVIIVDVVVVSKRIMCVFVMAVVCRIVWRHESFKQPSLK